MKKTLLVCFIGFASALIFMFSMRLGDYPKLNSCFKASVSKKLICSQNADYVRLKNVSKHFLNAVVMSEDDSFYAHSGFDWKEFRKSMAINLRQFSFVRGGSTITQQLVKNVYLSQSKTISRKVIEARLAYKVETENSKKLILEKYINAIEFGKDIWGLKQAARFYFKKQPAHLDPLESLYLVILLPSPVKYSQTFFKKELSAYQKKRMRRLLKRMKRRGFISSEKYKSLEKKVAVFLKEPVQELEETLPELDVDIEREEWAKGAEDAEVEAPEVGEFDAVEDISVEPKQTETYQDIGGQAELIEEEVYPEDSGRVENVELNLDSENTLEEQTSDQP